MSGAGSAGTVQVSVVSSQGADEVDEVDALLSATTATSGISNAIKFFMLLSLIDVSTNPKEEEVRFELTELSSAGFQDQSLKPLGHSSKNPSDCNV